MLTLEESLRKSLRHCRLEPRDEEGFSLTGEFLFEFSFPGFAGHFPGRPVLPAIVQLAAVRHLAELALHRKLIPVRCQRVKFSGMVLPQEVLQVKVKLLRLEQAWQAEFSLHKDGGMVAGGRLDLACPDE